MVLMQNEFEGKPEIIFMDYEGVVKSPYPFLLNKINTELAPYYESFLDMNKIKGLDIYNLTRIAVQRTDKNILRYLAKSDFDCDQALKDLKNRYLNLYEESELLSMGGNMDILLAQKFTKKIYLYTEEYDIRIHMDIQNIFHDMQRVTYVSGNIEKVLEKLEGITSYMVGDIDHVYHIIKSGKADYTNIMLANYGYNYYMDDDTKKIDLCLDIKELTKDVICKFGTFTPANLTEKHFSRLQIG
jgi:hypothetical protein